MPRDMQFLVPVLDAAGYVAEWRDISACRHTPAFAALKIAPDPYEDIACDCGAKIWACSHNAAIGELGRCDECDWDYSLQCN